MKTYVFISLIILCSCIACRSSSNSLDSSVRVESNETKKEVQEESIRQEKQLLETSKTSVNTQIDEEITLVTYDPASGNIQAVQTTRRTTGRNELADSARSGSDVSGIDKTTNTDTNSQTNIESDEHRESKGDSRIVQGIEWFYIAAVSGIVIFIIWLIKRKKT